MLEYVKTVLQKVSFNDTLFRKELSKSLKWLSEHERAELHKWINRTYGSVYKNVFVDSEITEDLLR
jgi:hypothetical protein